MSDNPYFDPNVDDDLFEEDPEGERFEAATIDELMEIVPDELRDDIISAVRQWVSNHEDLAVIPPAMLAKDFMKFASTIDGLNQQGPFIMALYDQARGLEGTLEQCWRIREIESGLMATHFIIGAYDHISERLEAWHDAGNTEAVKGMIASTLLLFGSWGQRRLEAYTESYRKICQEANRTPNEDLILSGLRGLLNREGTDPLFVRVMLMGFLSEHQSKLRLRSIFKSG